MSDDTKGDVTADEVSGFNEMLKERGWIDAQAVVLSKTATVDEKRAYRRWVTSIIDAVADETSDKARAEKHPKIGSPVGQ